MPVDEGSGGAVAAAMTCREFVELVTEYLEGTMAPADRARLEAHLALCDACTEYLRQIRSTIVTMGKLREEQIPEPAKSDLLDVFRRWKAE